MIIPPELTQFIATFMKEFAWLVLILSSFVAGLIFGAVIKNPKSIAELTILVLALLFVLIGTGYVDPALDLYDKAIGSITRLIDLGGGLKTALTYSSPSFLIGFVLGLWKG